MYVWTLSNTGRIGGLEFELPLSGVFAELTQVFGSITEKAVRQWIATGTYPADEADFMPLGIRENTPELVALDTPTQGRNITLAKLSDSLRVRIDFGERGSLEAAQEILLRYRFGAEQERDRSRDDEAEHERLSSLVEELHNLSAYIFAHKTVAALGWQACCRVNACRPRVNTILPPAPPTPDWSSFEDASRLLMSETLEAE